MEPLLPDECRVLGVLIEKQMTTPDQYPLTLNAIVNGSNQKNNRFPVLEMNDDQAYTATEGLRQKGLVVVVEQSGARVAKYKHVAAEKLDCRPAELALLAELLMRGPQSAGELRTRASRMAPFESLPATEGFLRSLMERPEPLVRRLPPTPGTRAEKYAQLLCPEAHPIDAMAVAANAIVAAEAAHAPSTPGLADRVALLEQEVDALKEMVRKLQTP
jgi:uncharacterized protein